MSPSPSRDGLFCDQGLTAGSHGAPGIQGLDCVRTETRNVALTKRYSGAVRNESNVGNYVAVREALVTSNRTTTHGSPRRVRDTIPRYRCHGELLTPRNAMEEPVLTMANHTTASGKSGRSAESTICTPNQLFPNRRAEALISKAPWQQQLDRKHER